jgi:predicted nucleic acid binding AN1-type Zn finger protein
MQTNEPERPGVTPIMLVVGGTTTYCLWIQQSTGPSTKLILKCDRDGNVFAAIGDEEVCNDYTAGWSI